MSGRKEERQKNSIIGVEDESTRVPDPAELRAKSSSDPKPLSGSIMAKFKEFGYAKVRAIGPAATGKAFHAFSIARSKLTLSGIDAVATGSFFEVKIENSEEIRTGITLTIEDR
jgi:stage V sporulation protein SpoVS